LAFEKGMGKKRREGPGVGSDEIYPVAQDVEPVKAYNPVQKSRDRFEKIFSSLISG